MIRFEDYEEAAKYFYGKENHYWDLNLSNIKALLGYMGNPQEYLKIIQIAGTNGKGSVSAYLSYVLEEAGYRVGRYNSPAVFEKLENITVNNKKITEEDFTQAVNNIYAAMEIMEKAGKLPTIFELETALALEIFRMKKCDLVILEAGLGGENDATNVSKENELAVFTSIALDHTQYLGDTVEKIAAVKAGIIKDTATVVAADVVPTAKRIIRERAAGVGADLSFARNGLIKIEDSTMSGQTFSYTSEKYDRSVTDVHISMSGENQARNAALAIEAIWALNDLGYEIGTASLKKGLEEARLPGRFQVISEKPLFILDGGHNPEALSSLRKNIDFYLKDHRIIFIMGMYRDKDYEAAIDIMITGEEEVLTVTAPSKRGMEACELAEKISGRRGVNARAFEDIADAVNYAAQISDESTAVVAFGSLSILKDIRNTVMCLRNGEIDDNRQQKFQS